ncbi:hypothetical protein CPB83DRAFT_843316 [Crepidotus variabilis]|uniref:Uncharacterized protein n=1 Tax=Crepidotus variabilis TaxID=179855 RepID=A0A9P6ERY9_9AGAR|nr:hypothetical protein CPB83DRAFT_843316 [Crepidotus variabilis]
MGPQNPDNLPIDNVIQGTHGQLVAFFFFHGWTTFFGLPILLGIMVFSKRVQRHATFINLSVAFLVIGLASNLLLLSGKAFGPEPSRMLCLLQASLLYGMPSLLSSCALMVVLQMFFLIRAAAHNQEFKGEDHVGRLWSMINLPWIVYSVFVLATAVIGSADVSVVSRDRRFFYCSVDVPPLSNFILIYGALMLLTSWGFIVWTIVLLYRRWNLTSVVSIDLNFPIRIMLFGIYIVVAFSLSLISIPTPSTPVPDLVIATASTFFILIFGTQQDIVSVICFWKKPESGLRVDLTTGQIYDTNPVFESKPTSRFDHV